MLVARPTDIYSLFNFEVKFKREAVDATAAATKWLAKMPRSAVSKSTSPFSDGSNAQARYSNGDANRPTLNEIAEDG